LENLICLCANCHQRADQEAWNERSLKEFKERPCVQRQNTSAPVQPRTHQVEIIIAKDFVEFDEYQEAILRHALANFLRVSVEAIKIIAKMPGSTRLVISLPQGAADLLLAAYKANGPMLQSALPMFPITGMQSLGKMAEASKSNISRIVRSTTVNHDRRHVRIYDVGISLKLASEGQDCLAFQEFVLRAASKGREVLKFSSNRDGEACEVRLQIRCNSVGTAAIHKFQQSVRLRFPKAILFLRKLRNPGQRHDR
jgi:hypothetical protein